MNRAETTPCIVSVTEDDEHFLVQIPPIHRERAKKIRPRKWDGKKRAWVYEKSPYIYAQLVEEFKEDAVEFTITKPKASKPAKEIDPQDDDTEANDVIIDQDEEHKLSDERFNQLQDSLKVQERLLETIHNKLIENTLAPDPDETPIKPEHCHTLIREMFYGGAGPDPELQEKLKECDFFADRNKVINRLEEYTKSKLRILLDMDAEERMSLNDLIKEAYESEAIGRSNRNHLTHFRVERNSFIHDDETDLRKYVRYMSALSSLALAWNSISIT